MENQRGIKVKLTSLTDELVCKIKRQLHTGEAFRGPFTKLCGKRELRVPSLIPSPVDHHSQQKK